MREFTWRAFVASAILIGLVVALFAAYALRTVLVVVFIAIVFSAAIRPLALRLQHKLRIGLGLAILLVYASLLLLGATMVTLVVPIFLADLLAFLGDLPGYLTQIAQSIASAASPVWGGGPPIGQPGQLQALTDIGFPAIAGLIALPLSLVTTLAWAVSIFALAFFWLLERDVVLWRVGALTPPAHRRQVYQTWIAVERRLGAYVLGQILAGAVIGTLSFIGLTVLGVRYALALALLAGLTEWIPFIGPIIAGIPAVLIAFFQAPWLGLAVVVLYVVIQQVEGNLIYPKIQERVSKVPAFWLLLSLIAGAELMGLVGALIAVPVAVTVGAIVEELTAEAGVEGAAPADGGKRAA